MKTYEVRVRRRELGYYSFYKIKAHNSDNAESLAKKKFNDDFANGKLKDSDMDAYTINNPDRFDSIGPFMDEIKANM